MRSDHSNGGDMRTITPLPADLSELGREELRQAIDLRRERGQEITAIDVDHVSSSEIRELRAINTDLERLTAHVGQVQPHPGHPTRGRDGRPLRHAVGSRPKPDGLDFGRIEGIGWQFIEKAALDGTSGGTLVQPFYDQRIRELPQRSLFVRSLIPTAQTTGDKVWYLRQTVATHAAAAVAAGAEKPKSTYTVARIETLVTTIAHVTEAMDRGILSDHDELTSFLDNQLRLGVLLEEEDQILNGSGTPPNLLGILNTPGLQTQAKGADPVPDAIYKAITLVRNQFTEPDGIVIHPNDWRDIRILKDANGLYVLGDPADEPDQQLFGLEVVTSPLIAEGTALVGAFGVGAQVWDREQARVTFTESGLGDTAGQEMFTRNQVRFRGESRIAFGVIRPASFVQVTGI